MVTHPWYHSYTILIYIYYIYIYYIYILYIYIIYIYIYIYTYIINDCCTIVIPLLYHGYTMVKPCWLPEGNVASPHVGPFFASHLSDLVGQHRGLSVHLSLQIQFWASKKTIKIATNWGNSSISGASKTTMFFPSCPWRSLTTLLLSPNQALLCHIEAPAEERRDHVFASRGQDRLRHLLHASLAFPGGVFKRWPWKRLGNLLEIFVGDR